MMTNNANPNARYNGRPLVVAADLTPTTAATGSRVSYTDNRGRKCIGLIANAFPGYVAAHVLEVEGVAWDSVISFPMAAIAWPTNGGTYSPAELAEARKSHPKYGRR